ncbi:hypothetical protein BCT86_02150 [Vibrio breoganii]|uniref:Uncharacterized protein n=1 Tax=Vibrio breoganii TaxID=553239 RepID=A0AAN1CTD2_9VIBR|nr:hypothetical protein [Vibrio breoganii]ANO34533.1 hypothetical protein A6E01_15135 [Vibrio breoganii]PMK44425.1 hypothetical protein BCU00_09665 [Vibrio breoganii]PML04520.1 hypothetical protein BCT86_02150 [Vibrio breoganii]PMO34678.1 hypothetical protein BCT12_12380 [Vibrio breoganii]PMO54837.1 hypothetical protein BCT07_16140 [Vibrio breoganii]
MDISSNMLLINRAGLTNALSSPFESPITQGQQAVKFVFDAIDAVRLHRSFVYEEMTGEEIDQEAYAEVKSTLFSLSNKVSNYSYLGSRPERHVLSMRLEALSQTSDEQSLSKRLVVHGQTIRLLFFCCDCAVLRSLKGQELSMTRYNEQWQTLMDTVDALTQYRICISSVVQNGLRNPKLLVGRASNLLNKAKRFQDQGFSNQYTLDEAIARLADSMHDLTKGEAISAPLLYLDTSFMSFELIKVYKQIVRDQLNRCKNQQDSGKMPA